MPPLGHPSAGASPNVIRPCEWGPGQAPDPPIELVGRIAIPVAIIHGDRDRYIPASDAEELYRACSPFGRRLEVVVGMGHAFDAKALPAVKASVEWLLADEKAHDSRCESGCVVTPEVDDRPRRCCQTGHGR